MKVRGVDVVAAAKATFRDFREDDLQGMAAQVAYNVIFAIVPLLIFLTALSGFVARAFGAGDAMDSIMRWLVDNLPRDAAEALREPIESVVQREAGGVLSFGALTALWGGKRAIAAMMKGLNVAFDVPEGRPWLRQQAVAVGLTVALGLAIILASTLFLLGEQIGEALASLLGLGHTWPAVWSIIRWPLIALLLVVGLAVFYWSAPNADVPFRWVTPGSVLAVILWGVATYGLGIYFRLFGGYEAYGALGGVLAFIFWVYVMSLILLLGGELNAVLYRQEQVVVRPRAGVSPAPREGAERRPEETEDSQVEAQGATQRPVRSAAPSLWLRALFWFTLTFGRMLRRRSARRKETGAPRRPLIERWR